MKKKIYRKKRTYKKKRYNPAPRLLRPQSSHREITSGRFPIAGMFQFATDTADLTTNQLNSLALNTIELKMVVSFNSFYRDVICWWGRTVQGENDNWPNALRVYVTSRVPQLAYNTFEDPVTSFIVPENETDNYQPLQQYNPYANHMDRYQTHWCYKIKVKWSPSISFGQEFNSVYSISNLALSRGMKYSVKCAFFPNGTFAGRATADAQPIINGTMTTAPAMYSRDYRPDAYWWDMGRPFRVIFKNPIVMPPSMNNQRIWSVDGNAGTITHSNFGYLDVIMRVFMQPRENQNDTTMVRACINPGEFQFTKYFVVGKPGNYKYTENRIVMKPVDVEMY